jgi:two-component system, LuxR family, response regulator FixJ
MGSGRQHPHGGPPDLPGPPSGEAGKASMESQLLGQAVRPVVAVVDDEPQVRRFLTLVLEPMGVEVAEFGCSADFLAQLDNRRFDCALVDLRLPDGTGLDIAASVRSRGLPMALVLVSGYANVRVAVQAVRDGMIDVLEKPFAPADVQAVVNRGLSLCRQRQAEARKSHELRQRMLSLTDSERRVLDLVLAGLPNKVIARTLSMGLRTVESRKQQLYMKLGAGSVSELVRVALAAGITAEPQPAVAG